MWESNPGGGGLHGNRTLNRSANFCHPVSCCTQRYSNLHYTSSEILLI